MTGDRYRNYRFVREVLYADVFGPTEREILADAAEGLLLSRSVYGAEVDDLRQQVSVVLDELVASDRMRYGTAVELRTRIEECGPDAGALLRA
jgi:hypothetical protein